MVLWLYLGLCAIDFDCCVLSCEASHHITHILLVYSLLYVLTIMDSRPLLDVTAPQYAAMLALLDDLSLRKGI